MCDRRCQQALHGPASDAELDFNIVDLRGEIKQSLADVSILWQLSTLITITNSANAAALSREARYVAPLSSENMRNVNVNGRRKVTVDPLHIRGSGSTPKINHF